MMDDLISRKAVAEKMKNRRDYVGRPSDPDCIIADEPSVPAVPLEPLCVWLAGYAAPPNYALEAVFEGYKIQPNFPVITVNYYVEAWKYHFRELLKSGLMDTEETDARP